VLIVHYFVRAMLAIRSRDLAIGSVWESSVPDGRSEIQRLWLQWERWWGRERLRQCCCHQSLGIIKAATVQRGRETRLYMATTKTENFISTLTRVNIYDFIQKCSLQYI